MDEAHLVLGIENGYIDAGHTQESVGYSRARIARGGYEHVYVALVRRVTLYEVGEEARHESCTDVLEGTCGSMIKFQTVDAVVHLDERNLKLQRVVNDGLEVVGGDVFTKEGLSYLEGYLLQREVFDMVEKRWWQWRDALRHIKAFVGSQTFNDSLAEGCLGGLTVCAVVFHIVSFLMIVPIVTIVTIGAIRSFYHPF